jgi:DNA-binding XRE family transcriptional regulator
LIDDALPPTARTGRAFWSNRRVGAHQAAAWMESGYHVIEVDLETEQVTFGRPIIRYTVRREGDEVWWTGSMVRALRAHLGMNQAGLAELLGVRQQTVSEWETSVYAPTRARSKHLSMVAERAGFAYEKGEQNE